MTEIVISGAMGRMGRAVLEAAAEDPDAAVVGLTEAPDHPAQGQDADFRGKPVRVGKDLPATGRAVLVDFSVPQAAVSHARTAAKMGWPVVIGTTGLGKDQQREIEAAARKVAVVRAANFSTGVTLLRSLAQRAAKALGGDADVEIVEIHHNRKRDAPSGTALALADAVRIGGPEPNLIHGRRGPGERMKGEIGVHAVRAGDIAGDHTVLFALAGERVELTHRAHGRAAFARGAVRAAHFAAKAAPGLYGMEQVLGLEESG
jgi:4-hydroxy-tetrahydrodipicolinate reductase